MENERRTWVRRALVALNLVIPSVTGIVGIVAWHGLPSRVPVHFDLAGRPDRWAGRGWEVAVLFFMLPWATAALFFAAAALTRWSFRHPRWINIPNKEAFLALPPERQADYRDLVVEFLFAVGVAIETILLTAVLAVIQVASGPGGRLPWWGVWPGMGATLLLAAIYTVRLIRGAAGFRP
ncbi:MAG: DUF1648 domain-containing protein [Acidobacteria bacterium]|nr:DUF1648 domain-containing protein [Acidobacteriota bacterium]